MNIYSILLSSCGINKLMNHENWARIFKRLWSPGIDSKEWIPPAYVAWRAGYNKPIPPRFLAPMDCLKIPALFAWRCSSLPPIALPLSIHDYPATHVRYQFTFVSSALHTPSGGRIHCISTSITGVFPVHGRECNFVQRPNSWTSLRQNS
jgi:hypothetical protein